MSSHSVLDFLTNKRVFVFDTETTGLPAKGPSGFGSYWDYRDNSKYESARIVSIAWAFIENYDRNNVMTREREGLKPSQYDVMKRDISHFIRHPEGFSEITNSNIHGITFENAFENGLKFNDILENCGLGETLLSSDYIVAHNAGFDLHVLLNELYRVGTELAMRCINHLLEMRGFGRIVCTAILGTDICKLDFPSQSNYQGKRFKKSYKMPKLLELYKHYYGVEPENQHSADGDVRALLDVMRKM
jgi:DNA polymerase III epsilon subunit-like protein